MIPAPTPIEFRVDSCRLVSDVYKMTCSVKLNAKLSGHLFTDDLEQASQGRITAIERADGAGRIVDAILSDRFYASQCSE